MSGPLDGPSRSRTRETLDELGHRLLGAENTQSVLQRVVHLVQQVMPAGAEASVTLVRDEQATTVAFTGEVALRLDEMQYGRGYGPASRPRSAARSSRSPTPAARDGAPTTWPPFSRRAC
jgi:hypothetical protein